MLTENIIRFRWLYAVFSQAEFQVSVFAWSAAHQTLRIHLIPLCSTLSLQTKHDWAPAGACCWVPHRGLPAAGVNLNPDEVVCAKGPI